MWDWLDRYDLLRDEAMREHIERTRPHYTVACYFPAADADLLTPTAQYTAWAFIIDDVFDDAITAHNVAQVEEATSDLIKVALQEDLPTTNAGRALSDNLDAMSAGRSVHWRAALGDSQARWLRHYLREAHYTRSGRVMGLNEYLAHRRFGVDELVYMLLEEFANDLELVPEVRNLPAMFQARKRGLEWIGLYNDIYSADKEAMVGYMHNSVLIIQDNLNCSMQEAVDATNQILTGQLAQFEAACQAAEHQVEVLFQKRTSARRDGLQMVDNYRALIRGNFDYHIGTRRYVGVPAYLPAAQNGSLAPGWTAIAPDLFRHDDTPELVMNRSPLPQGPTGLGANSIRISSQ
ncbi:hypothetical protein CRH09_26680 [Nocardia terpenica]|uniref:Terpene synthase n=2 Tax=Nocardia terpenica TaxID=455432 RepID=A0A291RPM9_9NOCA|nr:hypothetical protein CRH09_26680 [Nocardia terpenica]